MTIKYKKVSSDQGNDYYVAYTTFYSNKYKAYFLVGKVYDYNTNKNVHSQYICMSEQRNKIMGFIGMYQEALIASYEENPNNHGLQFYVHRGSSIGVENETTYYEKEGVHLF